MKSGRGKDGGDDDDEKEDGEEHEDKKTARESDSETPVRKKTSEKNKYIAWKRNTGENISHVTKL